MPLIDFKWYALQVRSKFETRAAAILVSKGYQVFVPVISKDSMRGGRGDRPALAFSNYVFCQYQSAIRERMVDSPGVLKIVGYSNVPVPVTDDEISSLRILINARARVFPWQFISSGQRIRVAKGPLCGVEGIFIQDKGASRVIVSVLILRRALMVEVAGEDIVPLPGGHQRCTEPDLERLLKNGATSAFSNERSSGAPLIYP